MITIACAARKGGVGKSLCARSLAVHGLTLGMRTAILDCDPQATAWNWSKRRESPAPTVVQIGGSTIPEMLKDLKSRKAEITFLDLPPFNQPLINVAAKAAHFTLIVTEATAESLEQVGSVAAIIKGLGKTAGIVINRASPRTTALILARGALAAFEMPICKTAITNLIGHSYASAEGQTITEREPGGKGAIEIGKLWDWVVGCYEDAVAHETLIIPMPLTRS